jgi:hypothetical protein
MDFIKNGKIYKFNNNNFYSLEENINIVWNTINNIKNEHSQKEVDIAYRNSLINYNKSKLKCKYNI